MPRLQRCTAITTGSESSPRTNNETSESGFQSCRRNARAGAKEEEEDDLEAEEERLDDLLPKTIKRSKPFKYVYEKEIVMYAYFKVSATIPSLASPLRGQSFETECSPSGRFGQKLDYHSTECIYAPTAYRGYARALVKDLEAVRPSAIVDLVRFLSHPSLPPSHETHSCSRSRAVIHTDISRSPARRRFTPAKRWPRACPCAAAARAANPIRSCRRRTGSEGVSRTGGRARRSVRVRMEWVERVMWARRGRSGKGRCSVSFFRPPAVPLKLRETRPSRHRRAHTSPSRHTESCVRCGLLTSQALCQACMLLEGLNRGVAKVDLQAA